MEELTLFQLLGLRKKKDSIAALDEQLKEYLSEIITLRHVREEQMRTISELRSENFHLKKELRQLKGQS